MRLRSALAALCLLWAMPAGAASVSIGYPCVQYQLPSTCADFQNLMLAINAILTPLIPNVGSAVNNIELLPAITGGTAIINLQSGADTNASIGLAPNGNGNIVLWAGDTAGTGVLQFANASSFPAATGFAACPGVVPNRPPLGVKGVVSGYFLMQDWLGVSHGVPAC